MAGTRESIRVLHVDDDPEVAEVTAAHLRREDDGFEVEIATSTDEGLDRLDRGQFDCVLSDYVLSERDGVEFLEAVRAEHPDLPFVLYTSKGSEEVASDAISAGVTDYLQKETGASQYAILANRIRNAVERRIARRTAERAEERLHILAEHADDILWMYTADWEELLFINSAYEEIWGRSIEELREYPPSFQKGVHPEDREITREAMDRLSSGESIDIEFRVNAEEDFGRWVWVKGSPVFDDGEVTRVTGFARDVTRRKENFRELERQNARLEEFAGVVSHDLRNPLNVASGRLELAADECESEHLDVAAGALDRMGALIDDMRSLSLAGQRVGDLEAVDLPEAVEGCWRNVETGSARLVVETGDTVRSDGTRLKQLLENLLRNSVEHGGDDVTVRIGDLPDGFYVEDDGPGIPEDRRTAVFEPGYSREEGGTGFGLSIVKDIAEAHGWTVDLVEGADGGARFEFHGVRSATG